MNIPGSFRQSKKPRNCVRFVALQAPRRRRMRGAGLIELLVASLLLCIGIMGVVNTWAFSFRVTQNTDDKGIAYSLARQAVERIKMTGFYNTAEGSSVSYYNLNQASVSSSSTSAYFKVTTSVVSDSVQSGTAGVSGAVPANEALRQVTVTVQNNSTGSTVFSTKAYLVRAGI